MPRLPRGLRPGGCFDEWIAHRPRAGFLDVDGTTLGSSPRATPAVAAAYASTRDSGMALGFATGRLPRGLTPLKDQLGAAGIDVVHNGAQIFEDGTAVATWPLTHQAARRLADWCTRHHVYAELYVGGRFYVTDLREDARPGWEEVSGEPDGLVSDLDLAAVEVTKATVNAFPPTLLSDILEASRSLGCMAEVSTAPFFPGIALVNVTREGVDKGTGVAWAAGRLGVAPEDLLVVGDGDNDVPMFRVAGTAVAMGQAPDHVLAAAHLVTGTVEEDGLAQVLRADLGEHV